MPTKEKRETRNAPVPRLLYLFVYVYVYFIELVRNAFEEGRIKILNCEKNRKITVEIKSRRLYRENIQPFSILQESNKDRVSPSHYSIITRSR